MVSSAFLAMYNTANQLNSESCLFVSGFKVTPSSKAEKAGIVEGLLVQSINDADCEGWTHSDALNSIKRTGSMLKLILSR